MATEQIAALREEYGRMGVDVNGLSDLELLIRELEQTRDESRQHKNKYDTLLQDQVARERAARTAARRGILDDERARAGIYLHHILEQEARPVNEVLGRAANLPDDGKASAQQVRDLKQAADRANWMVSGLARTGLPGVLGSGRNVDNARRRSPELQVMEKQLEEIHRLRDVITDHGQRLHAERGPKAPGAGRCECPGCELIRDMDDVAPQPEEANATSPPSRFSATPAEVDAYLRKILAEDTYLRYQQAIGGRSDL
ncbi:MULTISPECIES: hypothetical protein [Streptomyces]|uniref:hypothetical protein n=1 Tax=Streptomyces TaxID=1883 RepID=UPI0004CD3586|nr:MULTISPECIES: hypothetical protein [Streptomyces]KOT51133.1 hypothetical protein ADK43_32575 [Streptomyces rimosus subsp. rimosus]